MPLTTAQLQAIKADIIATPELNAHPNNSDGNFEIAKLYNKPADPDYYVWSSSVARASIYNNAGDGGSLWDWTIYKGQAVSEQNAWVQMFMGDAANFGKVNLRAGIGKIFTGSAQQNAQRDHILSLGRRKATRLEKLLALAVVNPPANSGNNTGNARGSTTNPDELGFEGAVNLNEIEQARNS